MLQIVQSCQEGCELTGNETIENFITVGNIPLKICFCVITPTCNHRKTKDYLYLDIRKQRTDFFIDDAKQNKYLPYWIFNKDGRWWSIPITKDDLKRSTIPCDIAEELNDEWVSMQAMIWLDRYANIILA